MPFKLRYLAGLWIAVELLSLPAAAQVVHRVSFSVQPHVIAAEIPVDRPGEAHFVVSSNAPFAVVADDIIGEIDISVSESGTFGLMDYGSSAQLPGESEGCVLMLGPHEQVVYRAERRTAAKRGDGVEQAVVMSFIFDPAASPRFDFTVGERAVVASACEGGPVG